MVTEKEFLEIVEKHLIMRDDGSVYIKDSALAKKYEEFLKKHANKSDKITKGDNNGICPDVFCE